MIENGYRSINVARYWRSLIMSEIPVVLRMVRGLLLFRAWLLAAGQKLLAEELV
jgi:hypothetical protein